MTLRIDTCFRCGLSTTWPMEHAMTFVPPKWLLLESTQGGDDGETSMALLCDECATDLSLWFSIRPVRVREDEDGP